MPNNSRESEKKKKLYLEIAHQMVLLSTAGFGLVAALAWNNLIQELVNSYIKTLIPIGGTIITLAIYAIIVTILAVLVTLQLSKFVRRLEED